MRQSTLLVILSWFTADSAIAAPLDDVAVTPLPGPASCYAGTAGPDNVMFLRTKLDQFDCDFSGGGQICLNRREFQGDGTNGRPVSLGSPIIQKLSVTGAGDRIAFTELGFNACVMATASQFDEGCADRDLFGIDPHSFSANAAGTQLAMTRIDLGAFPNLPMNEIYILNSNTFVLEEFHQVIPGGNQFLQIESVDFTVDGEYLIIDAYDPIAGLWSIYAVDRSNSAVTSIVPPVAGLALRNPTLAQTSDDHIVFDAQDTSTGVNTVFAANLLTGDLVQVATTGLLSYPSYTGDDGAVVFSESDNSVSTTASIDIQYLASDRMTPLGNRSRWLTNGGVPAVYRRGTWDGTLKDPADCTQAVPQPEFDSVPTAGETIAFGGVELFSESPQEAITIKNLGTANLTVACSLIGVNPGDFNVTGCPINALAGGGEAQIHISCEPTTTGARTASLRLNTNDTDEPVVDFGLTCSGISGDRIFSDGFE